MDNWIANRVRDFLAQNGVHVSNQMEAGGFRVGESERHQPDPQCPCGPKVEIHVWQERTLVVIRHNRDKTLKSDQNG